MSKRILTADEFINSFLSQISFDLRSPASGDSLSLDAQVNPPINIITIYYPISQFGEYNYFGQTYRLPRPITVREILDSIYLFYNQVLPRTTIQAYLSTPGYSPQMKTFRDVLGKNLRVIGLTPYKDGHLVNLAEIPVK